MRQSRRNKGPVVVSETTEGEAGGEAVAVATVPAGSFSFRLKQKNLRCPTPYPEESVKTGQDASLNSFYEKRRLHIGPPFLYPIARRMQFISSLIESWGSDTEQTLAQSGSGVYEYLPYLEPG